MDFFAPFSNKQAVLSSGLLPTVLNHTTTKHINNYTHTAYICFVDKTHQHINISLQNYILGIYMLATNIAIVTTHRPCYVLSTKHTHTCAYIHTHTYICYVLSTKHTWYVLSTKHTHYIYGMFYQQNTHTQNTHGMFCQQNTYTHIYVMFCQQYIYIYIYMYIYI